MFLSAVLVAVALGPGDARPTFDELVARSPAGLLVVSGVTADVGLTADQEAKLRAALAAVEKEHAAERAKLAPNANKEHAALVERTDKTIRDALARSLTAEQAARWKQIEWQQLGYAAALARPEVQKAVELSDEQKGKLSALADRYEVDRNRLAREARGVGTAKTIPDTKLPQTGQPAPLTTPVRLKQEYDLAAKRVLTDRQLDRWYTLVGRPFPPPK